jgi:transmembrane sensor
MVASTADGKVRLFTVAAEQVASWRAGKLEFDGAPLSLVAREISRYSGNPTEVDARIANQPFSGVIAIHEGEAPARTLAQILSLDVTKVDGALRLEPRRK